jgi:hypothetical protein
MSDHRRMMPFALRTVLLDLGVVIPALLTGCLAGYGTGRELDWTLSFCLLLMAVNLGLLELETL